MKLLCALIASAIVAGWVTPTRLSAQDPARWLAHDLARQRPPIVTPRESPASVPAPPDAVQLFDGSDLSKWRDAEGGPARWKIEKGELISVANSGYLYTADTFGDCQLHVEWSAPLPAMGRSQARGNSGVFLMGLYEVQVLDSYENETYADGQAAAIYGQYPPLVNACLPPGQWQNYEIVFHRPRFREDGTLLQAARMTVLHNGILVQDNVELWGPTTWLQNRPYEKHPDRLPISLQDHGNPVRFRNIWLRQLPEEPQPSPPRDERNVVKLSRDSLQAFVGPYRTILGEFGSIQLEGDQLRMHMKTGQVIDLLPLGPEEFALRWTAGTLSFTKRDGRVTGFTMSLAGEKYPAQKVIEPSS